jgi:hypothetical protein
MALVIGNALSISGGISITNVTLPGEALYDTPGTYSWTAPDGVRSVSVVCIGGGGAGARGESSTAGYQYRYGGGGAGLGWKNNIPVVPGQMYMVQVGAGGTLEDTPETYISESGGNSFFISANVVAGLGGEGGALFFFDGGNGGGYVGDGGGIGGQGSKAPANPSALDPVYPYVYGVGGGSGGSTAGYTGRGGNAGTDGSTFASGASRQVIVPTAGQGGGAGGSWNFTPTNFVPTPPNPNQKQYSFGAGSGGSGTGVFGQGASGGYWSSSLEQYITSGAAAAYGEYQGTVGQPGSGGAANSQIANQQAPAIGNGFGAKGIYASNTLQLGGDGGLYGGGGGSVGPQMLVSPTSDRIGHGGNGAVRIIWGDGRSFPTNAGYITMRNLLSAQGQIAYDAAADNDWFSVSASDYGNVRSGIANATIAGVTNAQLTQTPDGTLVANRWYSLPSTQANGSTNRIPWGSYILGFAIRPYQPNGSSWTFQPYTSEAFKTSNPVAPSYKPFGSGPLTVQGTDTLYWLRRPSQPEIQYQFMYYSWSTPDSASLSWAAVSGFETGANGVGYAPYEPQYASWTDYTPGLGIVAQWVYTPSRYQW